MSDLKCDFDLCEIQLTPLASRGDLMDLSLSESSAATAEARSSFFGRYGLFCALVVVPCMLSVLYLFFIASDRYLSEAEFIVRSSNDSGYNSTAALMQSNGLSRAKDETYVVNAFINSRDAMDWLAKDANIRAIFSRPQADFVNRFPNMFTHDNRENFFRYYKKMISSDTDEETGISTIGVVAFSPKDAQDVATGLLRASEALVNRLNQRAEDDAVASGDVSVREARQELAGIERKLKSFRDQAGFVDAQHEDVAALKTVTSLTTTLAEIRANLQQLKAVAPNNPAIADLKEKAKSYEAAISRAKGAIAGDRSSIAAKLGDYDLLTLDATIAEKTLASAVAGKEAARQAAQRQHLYLQIVVKPNLSDQHTYPRRLLGLLLTFLAAEALYVIVKNLRQFAIEHAL